MDKRGTKSCDITLHCHDDITRLKTFTNINKSFNNVVMSLPTKCSSHFNSNYIQYYEEKVWCSMKILGHDEDGCDVGTTCNVSQCTEAGARAITGRNAGRGPGVCHAMVRALYTGHQTGRGEESQAIRQPAPHRQRGHSQQVTRREMTIMIVYLYQMCINNGNTSFRILWSRKGVPKRRNDNHFSTNGIYKGTWQNLVRVGIFLLGAILANASLIIFCCSRTIISYWFFSFSSLLWLLFFFSIICLRFRILFS